MINGYMSAPCSNCPFLKKGGVRLTMGRIEEITSGLLKSQGHTFTCHKTTVDADAEDEDEEGVTDRVDGPNAQHCGGALIFAEKNGNQTQMMRFAERLGLYDPAALAALKAHRRIFDSVAEMMKTAVDYEEGAGEPCSVVNANCTAPAGWETSSGVVAGGMNAEFECYGCSLPVCGACSTPHPKKRGKRMCTDCTEEE